jgi:hypothetical protein
MLECSLRYCICEQDVIDIISTLNVNKAVGHDIISNRMLLAVKNVYCDC